MQFQGLQSLVKTKFLDGDYVSSPWVKWMGLIAPRLTSPVTNDPPPTSTSTGKQGEMRQDANFLYVCVGTNQWKRTALNTF